MNPNFINLSLSLYPDDHHQQLQLSLAQDHSSSSSSSLSLIQPFLPLQETNNYNPLLINQDPKELGHHPSMEDCGRVIVENEVDVPRGLKISLWKRGEKDGHVSSKWVPSKIRLMGRMVSSNRSSTTSSQLGKSVAKSKPIEARDPDHNFNNNINISTTPPIRVCSDCNTTKTPLWRSGPRGPKSLCNACGIRQRKARRAMAAAAASTTTTTTGNRANLDVVANNSSVKTKKVQSKEKRLSTKDVQILPYKKRCTRIESSVPITNEDDDEDDDIHVGIKNPANCFEDFYINLSKNLAFHRVFPQDEKEAAILLMALSCGLVHG